MKKIEIPKKITSAYAGNHISLAADFKFASQLFIVELSLHGLDVHFPM